jgi:hypothetical protein
LKSGNAIRQTKFTIPVEAEMADVLWFSPLWLIIVGALDAGEVILHWGVVVS